MNLITQYVPHHKAQEYRDKGWDVEPMPGNHGAYSMLASMPEDTWKRLGDVTETIINRMGNMRDTTGKFNTWVQNALPGDEFPYFVGPTPAIRHECFRQAWDYERAGLVSLVQRRGRAIKETHAGNLYEYEYIAQKV